MRFRVRPLGTAEGYGSWVFSVLNGPVCLTGPGRSRCLAAFLLQ